MVDFKKDDILTFGRYFQNNSSEKTSLKWKILDISNESILLLSLHVIDAKPFHSNLVDSTWESSSLRRWLNTEFLNCAFTDFEKSAIKNTRVTTPSFRYPYRVAGGLSGNSSIVPGGDGVTDKIFILSFEEARKYFKQEKDLKHLLKVIVPWASDNIINNVAGVYPELKCEPTKYAKTKGVYCPGKDGAWWWLRSPGNTSRMATSTMSGIFLYHPGTEVNDSSLGVRPALWVKKEIFYTEEERKKIEEQEAKKLEEQEAKKLEEQRRIKEENEKRIAEEKKLRWKNDNLCQHCGNKFKGIFRRKCSVCGVRKDY